MFSCRLLAGCYVQKHPCSRGACWPSGRLLYGCSILSAIIDDLTPPTCINIQQRSSFHCTTSTHKDHIPLRRCCAAHPTLAAEECRRPMCFPFGACRLHSWIAPQMSRRNQHSRLQPPPLDTQEPSVPGYYLLFLATLQSTLISCSGVAAWV